MQHTYTEIMGQGGINKIVQKHARRGRRRVSPQQPDYLAAKAEEGTPRIKVVAYVAKKPRPEPTELQLAQRGLQESDLRMPRPQEDLWKLLLEKGVIELADIPAKVLKLRNDRKAWRAIVVADILAKEAADAEAIAAAEAEAEPVVEEPV